MIVVVGAAGTIGRVVCGFLEEWGEQPARRDFRLEDDEHVDARDPASLARALAGASACVNCADYRLNLEVMEGALAARCHYVDLGGLFHMTLRQLGLDGRFRSAGSSAILGIGSAPGKTNLLAAAGAARLGEEPRRLQIWAATRDPAAGGHPLPITYSARTLIDELRLHPVVLKAGQLEEVEPLSGQAELELPEVGRVEGIYTLHSELATLPSTYPTLEEASFRLSLAPGLVDKLLAVDENALPEPYVQSKRSVAVHFVELEGDRRRVAAAAVTRGGSARSTAEPAARAAVELAAGRVSAPGVHPPERAIAEPEHFLSLLDTEVLWL